MKSILEKAKSIICKFQNDITKYYNRCYIPISVFYSSDKTFLNASNIYTTYSSAKLIYWHLRLYTMEKQIGFIFYWLKFSLSIKRLHLVFNIMKLTVISKDLILG